MPLNNFYCPDKTIISVKDCLGHCPRPEGRCLALGHLTFIAESGRIWRGQSSVTQLIKPTRLAWLEITKNYTVNPDDMAFMMYGTLHHRRLEIINKRLDGLSEYTIKSEISGTIDRLEPDEIKPGFFKLMDFKLVGGYSIAKALGIGNKGAEVDPDMRDWELQLNRYRMLLEADPELSKLFPISRMLIQATVRDGGLKQINMLGIPCRMPLIPVKKLDDDYITEYFSTKDLLLHQALENNVMPPMCDYIDNWANRRCRSYCNVASFCPEGAKIKRVTLER